MNTDILIGIAIGGTGAFALSIAFLVFCVIWAKSEHAVRPDPYEQPIGEGWK